MPTVPLQPTDQFDAMNRVVGQQGSLVGEIVGGIDRFTGANATPRVNGLGTRQGQISPLRLATPAYSGKGFSEQEVVSFGNKLSYPA